MPKQFFKVHNNQADATDLWRQFTFIDGMEVTFNIRRPSMMLAMGHCNIEHRDLNVGSAPGSFSGTVSPCGWALRVGYRGPYASKSLVPALVQFNAPPWIPGSKTAGIILNRSDHYATGDFEAGMILNASGWYRIELWGLSYSALNSNVDGMAQVYGSSPRGTRTTR